MKTQLLFIILITLISTQVSAVTGRNPTGVNVNSNGTSTVFITFQNLDVNETSVDAFWCGDVTSTGVVVGTNPCVPGTLLGHLPKRNDFSRINGSGITGGNDDGPNSVFPGSINKSKSQKIAAPRNLTDIMSIPTAVIRRAYQEAQRGRSSEFFYIRHFVNNGISTYVTVTCRMGAGGARSPLALTRVDVDFNQSKSRKAITQVKQFKQIEPFSAAITYNGSGLIKGRWEVVLPGDVEPSSFDLLSEASLPAEERPLQKRYRLISRFQKFLAPNGKTVIPGPDPKLLPVNEKGLYRILFRVEASNDKEGNSDTLGGIVNTGGVAGFAMPTLRYFVGETTQLVATKQYPPITLLLPHSQQILDSKPTEFSWFELKDSKDVAVYKIEFYQSEGDKNLIASALIKPGSSSYKPVESVQSILNQPLIWKVEALDVNGKVLSSSPLRRLNMGKKSHQ
jgi:hypothetical protein